MNEPQKAIDEMWRRSDRDKLNGRYPIVKLPLGSRLYSFASDHLSRILSILMIAGFGLGFAGAILMVEWGINLPGLAAIGLTMAMNCLFILSFFKDFINGPQKQAEELPKKSVDIRVVGFVLLLIGATMMAMSVEGIARTIFSPTPTYVARPTLMLWVLSFYPAFIGAGFIAQKGNQLAMVIVIVHVVWAFATFVAFFVG